MSVTRWKHYFKVLMLILLVMLFGGCSNKSSSSDNTQVYSGNYTIGTGNHVILGPVEGAHVKVYKVPDMQTPIASAQSGEYGKFEVSLSGVNENDILLVVAEGGEDIDFDDDGIKDDTPTPFKGKLHLLCRVDDLQKGRANITVVSDLLYQYMNHLLPHVDEKLARDDFWKIVGLSAKELVRSNDPKEAYKRIVSFNPLKDRSVLDFDYDELFKNGDRSLMQVYHKGEEGEAKEVVLSSFFKQKNLSLHDDRLMHLRENLKVSLNLPAKVSLDAMTRSGTIQSFEELKQRDFFVKKKDLLTLQVNSIENGYKILKWHGCDRVSDDKRTCEVYNDARDRIISPIVVPEKLKLKENTVIVDASQSAIKFPNNSSSSPLRILKLTSDQLDTMDIYVDLNDIALRDQLKQLAENGFDGKTYILVNTTYPAFFRRITSVTKLQDSDYRYKVSTEFIKLTEIVTQGYISTQFADLVNRMPSGVKLVSSGFIMPSGELLPVKGSSDVLVMSLNESGSIDMAVTSEDDYDWSDTIEYPYSYTPEGNETNVDLNMSGKIVIKPYLNFDMSWSMEYAVIPVFDQIVTDVGVKIDTNNTLVMKYKKEFGFKKELLEKPITYTQTFTILGIPVVMSERINFVVGIKGPGKGKENDKAYFDGNATVDANLGVGANFEVSYNGSDVQTAFNLMEKHTLEGKVAAKAGIYGYIGAVPGVALYGFGIEMNNYLGSYAKGSFEGVASMQEIDEVDYNATLNVELGMGYYGLIQVYADNPKFFEDKIDDFVKKINEKIRGKYTEFWKAWPLLTYQTTWENALRETTEELGVAYPGILLVNGDDLYLGKEQNGYFEGATYSYTLKNVGGETIDWKVEASNDFPVTIVISSGETSQTVRNWSASLFTEAPAIRGTLEAGESATVTVEVPGFNMDENGKYMIGLKFYQLEHTASNMPVGLPGILQNNDNPTAQKHITLNIRPVDWNGNLTASVTGAKVKNLKLRWDDPVISSIDGFEIHYCEVDQSTPTECIGNMELSFAEINATQTVYETSLIQAVQSGLLEWNKVYLFRIYGTDHHASFNIGNTVVPAFTQYWYGGKSELFTMPPSPTEGIDLGNPMMQNDIYVIVEPGVYNSSSAKSVLTQLVNDLFDSKPEDSTLKVGIILEDFYGQNETEFIALSENREALVDRLESLDFPSSGSSSLPKALENLSTLSWSDGAQKSIVTVVGSYNNELVAGTPDTSSIKDDLLQQNITLLGVGVNGTVAPTHPLSTLIEYEIPLSSITVTTGSTVPELHEVMLPPSVF